MTRDQHDAIPHTTAMIADGTITNADIAPNAAIAKSKLDLAGAIIDTDIAANASIAQSKLALSADPGAHASRHKVGGADVLPDNSISKAMLTFGTWELIAEVTATSSIDYVDFTGLDINSDKMYVLLLSLTNPYGTGTDYYLLVEGDTNIANYYVQGLGADGTTITSGRSNSAYVTCAPGNERTVTVVFLGKDPANYSRAFSLCNRRTGGNVDINIFAQTHAVQTSNITSVRIIGSNSNGIGANSYIALFRVRTK